MAYIRIYEIYNYYHCTLRDYNPGWMGMNAFDEGVRYRAKANCTLKPSDILKIHKSLVNHEHRKYLRGKSGYTGYTSWNNAKWTQD